MLELCWNEKKLDENPLKINGIFIADKMLEIPSSVAFSSRREKQAKETEANNDDLPLAIQTFLWRQTR